LALTGRVYIAVPQPNRRRAKGVSVYRSEVRRLCRRLGLGILTVSPGRGGGRVEVVLDPHPYKPRPDRKELGRLLGEHTRRTGDPNRGGIAKMPLMTAYRQEALRCALLIREGTTSTNALRATGIVPNASKILRSDVYGWFERVSRGVYRITDKAGTDVARFAASGRLPELTAPNEYDPGVPRDVLRSGAR
jgi:hypothetical protein